MYHLKINDPKFLPHCGCQLEFPLNSGEAVLLTGENGLGKTTLLNRLFQQHSQHSSLVEQKALDIFYDRSLENLQKIFLKASGSGIEESFFLRMWEELGLSAKLNRRQSALSGGEGQALKICLGLAPSVPLYFLDEPSQYLDTRALQVLDELLTSLLKAGKSLCLVEHDHSWITFPLIHHHLIIREGNLVKEGTWNT